MNQINFRNGLSLLALKSITIQELFMLYIRNFPYFKGMGTLQEHGYEINSWEGVIHQRAHGKDPVNSKTRQQKERKKGCWVNTDNLGWSFKVKLSSMDLSNGDVFIKYRIPRIYHGDWKACSMITHRAGSKCEAVFSAGKEDPLLV